MLRISDLYKDSKEKEANKKALSTKKNVQPKKSIIEPEDIYNNAILLAKEKMDIITSNNVLEIDSQVLETLSNILKSLKQDKKPLMEFFYESTPSNYIYAHAVNVCILSLSLMMRTVYNEEQLLLMAIISFFHDAGMHKYMNIVQKNGRLNYGEKKRVMNHTQETKVLIINSKGLLDDDLCKQIADIAFQYHEREDGSGYPEGRISHSIIHMAKIIAISDVYEALTHNRDWRNAYNRAQAMEMILRYKGKKFSSNVVRLLIDELSIYPVGSIVILNDGRTARVSKVECNSPTRPEVEIIKDSNGDEVKNEYVNLCKQRLVCVEKIVKEQEEYEAIS